MEWNPYKRLIIGIALSIVLAVIFLTYSITTARASIYPIVASTTRVLDGDTIEVVVSGDTKRIRLNDIDAPEKHQPYGPASAQFLRTELDTHQTYLVVDFSDKKHTSYKRYMGTIFTQDGYNVNKKLVAAGLAWWYRKYSEDDSYARWEDAARKQNKGLWKQDYPIAPWLYRKGIKKKDHAPYYKFIRLQ